MSRIQRVEVCLIIGLALLPGLFFWRLLTPNPADRLHIAGGDFTEQYFPLRAFTAQSWVGQQIPLWNPYLYGGQPALADIQSGALYPPHVLEALLLGWGGPLFWGREIGFPVWALEWQIIGHFSLAAVGSYLFGRQLGLTAGVSLRRARFTGVIVSLVFTYSGYLTGFPVQQLTILQTAAWLPWLLLYTHLVGGLKSTLFGDGLKSVLLRRLIWGALIWAMAILAGHPQTMLYLVYLCLAYGLFCGWQYQPQPTAWWRKVGVAGGLVLITILWGCLIAAPQLLPTLEFISHSVRADLSYQAVSAGLPLAELVAVLYPGFLGGSPQYVGWVTLVLIAIALTLSPQRATVKFWAGAGLISLLVAFGNHTFLYSLFYLFLPGFEMVRQQERALLIYSFSAATLAGYGAMALSGPLPYQLRATYRLFVRIFRIVMMLLLVLTLFFIYGSTAATARGEEVNLFYGVLRHHLFGLLILGGMGLFLVGRSRRWLRRPGGMALLAGWLAFNLFTVNWQFNLAEQAQSPFTPDRVTQFLQSQTPPGRIVSGGLLPGGNSAASVYEVPDLTGNTPLQLASVERFFREMPAWRLWQLLQVRYVVDNRDIGDEGLIPRLVEGETRVFEMADPFPKAWLVGQVEVVPEDEAAIRRLGEADFDLRHQVIVAHPLLIELATVNPAEAQVTVKELSSTHLRVEVTATGHLMLVVSQIYYPGWQAVMDGQPVALRRLNVVQQGLIVSPGKHIIELIFWPATFWLGTIISMVSLLLAGGLYVYSVRY